MDGVCRVGTTGSLVRGEVEGSGQSLCSRIASVRGTSGPSFYLRNTCLIINVVPVTVVSFGRHTANPAMATPKHFAKRVVLHSVSDSLDFVRVTVKAVNQLFNDIPSFGKGKRSHGSKFGMQGRVRTLILFLARN